MYWWQICARQNNKNPVPSNPKQHTGSSKSHTHTHTHTQAQSTEYIAYYIPYIRTVYPRTLYIQFSVFLAQLKYLFNKTTRISFAYSEANGNDEQQRAPRLYIRNNICCFVCFSSGASLSILSSTNRAEFCVVHNTENRAAEAAFLHSLAGWIELTGWLRAWLCACVSVYLSYVAVFIVVFCVVMFSMREFFLLFLFCRQEKLYVIQSAHIWQIGSSQAILLVFLYLLLSRFLCLSVYIFLFRSPLSLQLSIVATLVFVSTKIQHLKLSINFSQFLFFLLLILPVLFMILADCLL